MHHIHARFSLGEVTRIRCYAPMKKGEPWEQVEGVRVKLSPVTGEPFGSATPGGQVELVIASPTAAQIFNDAPIGQEFDAVFSLVVKEAEGA